MLRYIILTLLLCITTGLRAQQWDNYRSKLRDKNVKVESTNLPIVFIEVGGKVIQRNSYILGRMKIIDNGEGEPNHADTTAYPGQHIDYEGWIALKYRGNTSFDASDKKPMGFRTLESDTLPDNGGVKKKVKILGMPKDNKWCFIAPWCDETMFRDVLSFELGRPWFDWVPRARHCEVFLDGTYYGVYVLSERVSKGKHRLDLDDPGEHDGDLTGDYHVSVDHGYDPYFTSRYHPWQALDGSKVASNYTVKYEYGDPDPDEFSQLPSGTRQALQNEIKKMEDSFMASNWKNPDGGYRAQIDVQSFIDYMLSTEVSMNIDGYRLSTHLYKHGQKRAENEGLDARWKTTLWDFNIAWGNADYYDGQKTNSWQYMMNVNFQYDESAVPFYWYRMLQDDLYVEAMKDRWKEYRENNYSNQRLMQTVDSLANLLTSGGAAQRNEQAWRIFQVDYIWPLPYYATDYNDAVSYLKGWIKQRLQFMDKHLLPPRDIITVPIAVATGWNADIVAEAKPAATYTTRAIDGSNRAFYSEAIRNNGGLPNDGKITSGNENVQYQLADYTTLNALTLQEYGETGTIEFDTPVETSELFILGTSGNGVSSIKITLNYGDGTSEEAGTYTIRDWSVSNNALQGDEAVSALGNIWRSNSSFSSNNHYCLFDFSLPVAARPLLSVTITSASNAYASIMAFSALPNQQQGHDTAIDDINCEPTTDIRHYDLLGRQRMHGTSKKGLTIMRQSDGTIRKIIRK